MFNFLKSLFCDHKYAVVVDDDKPKCVTSLVYGSPAKQYKYLWVPFFFCSKCGKKNYKHGSLLGSYRSPDDAQNCIDILNHILTKQ